MKDQSQFEDLHNECAVWEAMCPDAVDGLLTDAEQAAFDRHIAGCVRCSEEYEAAQRGAAWMGMLKGHTPEPPENMMARILAATSGSAEAYQPAEAMPFVPQAESIWTRPRPEPVKQGWASLIKTKFVDMFRVEGGSTGFHPHYAMTAAMAFFSVALSLNLMGVRLTDLRHLELKPGSIGRQVATASASAERSFSNLRVVYQVESRVDEFRNSDDSAPRYQRNDQRNDQHNDDQPKQDDRRERPRGTSELTLPPAAAPKSATSSPVRKEA
ncbi:anti-sigma factor family protein [Granulicella cerasi]|uniref:Anti-sigma factor family protein n=1 Tax=Granulicella cerasi TaxID=741063 RepID=A0ABW1ZD75_9BACT|nr:zf-HC2 domain-containing protein [Granulicella cerasi]